MGVPAFFRKLIKKYKILRNNPDMPVRELHIDGNCLFHPSCFKVLDFNKSETNQQILFEKMSERIIAYIDYLIQLTCPTDLVHIAVDGVAPLAKINQQRMRRFGYANNYKAEIYRKHNIKTNNSWSNIVITPGTQFMYDLHLKLKNYYEQKITLSTDPLYRFKIIYDSYMTPGEGEHKILQYIKENNHHHRDGAVVIYGLDADLIFLSMASHLNNIFLLRETNQFTSKSDNQNPEPDEECSIGEEMCYVDIDFAKKSINEEFNGYYDRWINSRNAFDQNLDLEPDQDSGMFGDPLNHNHSHAHTDTNTKILPKCDISDFDFTNDYIFVCYFLGNDFLPHLPSININIDAMELIFNVYMDVFQDYGKNLIQFVNGRVIIDNDFLLDFITILASKEEDFFRRTQPEYLKRHSQKRCFETEPHKRDLWKIENLKNVNIIDPIQLGRGEAHEWKYRYYSYYFKTDEHMQETIDSISHNYFEGLLWVARYYFENCPTWKWQYKYTHAPFLSDLMMYLKTRNIMRDFNTMHENPVDMYTQLVSVVPSTFAHILPNHLKSLSNSAYSPIIDMFPQTYHIDMIYKTQLYKCIPMIPYLDVKRVEKEVSELSTLSSFNDRVKSASIQPFIFTILPKLSNNSNKKQRKKQDK
jgi:5'-3' exonuclease